MFWCVRVCSRLIYSASALDFPPQQQTLQIKITIHFASKNFSKYCDRTALSWPYTSSIQLALHLYIYKASMLEDQYTNIWKWCSTTHTICPHNNIANKRQSSHGKQAKAHICTLFNDTHNIQYMQAHKSLHHQNRPPIHTLHTCVNTKRCVFVCACKICMLFCRFPFHPLK